MLCIIYLPLCVAIFGELLAKIAGIYVARKADKVEEEFLNRAMTLADFELMDLDKDVSLEVLNKVVFNFVTADSPRKTLGLCERS